MTTSLKALLDDIIKHKKLTVYFQCIVANKNATIFAYEALIRGPFDSPLRSPLTLFKEAKKQG